MSDPILPLLSLLSVALLLLAIGAGFMPVAAVGFVAAALSGLGLLLALLSLLLRTPPAALPLPAGPPELPLHLALDALSGYFLVLVLAAGTAIAVLQAHTGAARGAIRRAAVCGGGMVLTLLAGDAVTLTVGLTLAGGAIWLDLAHRQVTALLVPLVLLAAVCLLTPAGFAPRFDAIRAAPPQIMHATTATLLTIAAVACLIGLPSAARCGTRDALVAGLVLPVAAYLLLRLILDLAASGADPFWGFLLLLTGCALAVGQGWRAAAERDIDDIAGGLVRGQAGLAMAGTGLTVICRLADLPTGAGDALMGTLLLAAGSVAGTAIQAAAHAIADSAGTYRLSRLGGLVHLMPASATALSASLLSLTVLPPGLGFAGLWLLLRAFVSAPRTGGLLPQILLALTAGAIALAGVLATTAALRLIGIAVLSRPRTPRGAGAREIKPAASGVLLGLAGVSVVIGILPGPVLEILAGPIVQNLTGVQAAGRAGPFDTGPGYLALPVAALLGFCCCAALLVRRWRRPEPRVAGPWTEGMQPPYGLPFGDPLAQSAGHGFLPALPVWPRFRLPRLTARPVWRLTPAQTGFWLILAGAAACLAVLALTGSKG